MNFFSEFLPTFALFIALVIAWQAWGEPAFGSPRFAGRLVVAMVLISSGTFILGGDHIVIGTLLMCIGIPAIPPIFKD